MFKFDNGGIYINDVTELPQLAGATYVYLDTETTSGNSKLDSLNPWHNCSVAGFAITVDDLSNAYYIDYMHLSATDQAIVRRWLGEILDGCSYWVNHNIKYDAHVIANDLQLFPVCCLICTLTLAKIIDSDRIMRGGYGLDALSLGWLKKDISNYEQRLKPFLNKNKDYGRIPGDILGEYACQDVLTNRELWLYENEVCPEQCHTVWQNEIVLTRNLWQLERNGLTVKPQELKIAEFKALNRMSDIDERLTEIVGRSFRPHVSDDCFDVVCNQYGLPILAYTKDQETGEDTENPSFDKHALKMYAALPTAPKDVVHLIQEFRALNQLNNLFLVPWQEVCTLDVINASVAYLRSTYNQSVRTGRMSCSDPNAQQLSKIAKLLIHPKPGYAFISIDYSQIEFRFIVHYIQDVAAIQAYNENPDTDFHLWIAGQCGIKRKPAKTVNFGVAFGEGKRKLIKQLSTDETLVETITSHVKGLIADGQLEPHRELEVFNMLAERRALDVFNTYHRTFPTLKATAKDMEMVLKRRGYIYNLYGRHRHLPTAAAYRAFNTVNQSSAADMIKERINALAEMLYGTPIEMVAVVHDEVLFQAPIDIATDPRTVRDLVALMESPPIELRVPVRCSVGISLDNWAHAGADDNAKPLLYNRSEAGYLEHIK